MTSASRESVAYQQYDERFAPVQAPARKLREAPRARRAKKAKSNPSVALCVIIVAVVSAAILICQMQLTQLTAQVSAQSEQLDKLTAESVSLSTKQAYDLDLTEIESAAAQLGMVKMDSSQIEYVELVNSDSITVSQSGVSLDALFAGLARSFSAVVEYIR